MNPGTSNVLDSEEEEIDLLPDDEIEGYNQEHGITRDLLASRNNQPEGTNSSKTITPETIARKNGVKRLAEPTDSMTTNTPSMKPARKKKKVEAPPAEDLDTDTPPSIPFKTILRVEKPPSAMGSKQKSLKPTYLEMEPFGFMTTGTFSEYLDVIASALPCPRQNLVTTRMQWKTEKPKTADPHPLMTDAGFTALIEKVTTQKPGDRTIILFMKPHLKPISDERPWVTTNEDTAGSSATMFDFRALETMDGMSIEEQKVKFDVATKDIRGRLEVCYPISNNPLFPDKHIYHNQKNSWYFDLTNLRLTSWANNIMEGKADETQPPYNAHFDVNARIKTIPKVSPMPSRSTVEPAPTSVTVPLATNPTQAAPPVTPAGSSFSDLIQLLVVQQLQQQQQQNQFMHAHHSYLSAVPPLHISTPHYHNPTLPPPGTNRTPNTSVPSSPSKVPRVSLDAFCDRYGISDDDKERLMKLGYVPGNQNIKTLDRADWKDDAGFATLTWRTILDAHDRFVLDAKKVLWD